MKRLLPSRLRPRIRPQRARHRPSADDRRPAQWSTPRPTSAPCADARPGGKECPSSLAPRPKAGKPATATPMAIPPTKGRVLHEAVTGHFAGDVEAARRYLIDEHPAGWRHLGGDFTKPGSPRVDHDQLAGLGAGEPPSDVQARPTPPACGAAVGSRWNGSKIRPREAAGMPGRRLRRPGPPWCRGGGSDPRPGSGRACAWRRCRAGWRARRGRVRVDPHPRAPASVPATSRMNGWVGWARVARRTASRASGAASTGSRTARVAIVGAAARGSSSISRSSRPACAVANSSRSSRAAWLSCSRRCREVSGVAVMPANGKRSRARRWQASAWGNPGRRRVMWHGG